MELMLSPSRNCMRVTVFRIWIKCPIECLEHSRYSINIRSALMSSTDCFAHF